MIDRDQVEQIVSGLLDPVQEFIVEVSVSPSNHIVVLIGSEQGITISRCVELSKTIEEQLDREKEDFQLEVSSAGLSSLKVERQYSKHIGRELEVLLNAGTKMQGTLMDVTPENFTLEYQSKEVVEGKKRKQLVSHQHTINYQDVKSTKVVVSFR